MNTEIVEKAFEYKDIDWNNVSLYKDLLKDIEVIELFKDKINWDYLSIFYEMNFNFLKKYKDYINWEYVCMYKHLSEQVIEYFKDYVDWKNIFKYQTLSNEFREKYEYKKFSKSV